MKSDGWKEGTGHRNRVRLETNARTDRLKVGNDDSIITRMRRESERPRKQIRKILFPRV